MKSSSGNVSASGSLVTSLTCATGALRADITGSATLTVDNIYERGTSGDISALATVEAKLSGDIVNDASVSGQAVLEDGISVEYSLSESITGSGTDSAYLEKLAGTFTQFSCLQKLYPIRDISVTSSGSFVNSDYTTSGLYSYIDEGVFSSDYYSNYSNGSLVSDSKTTYIQPSSVNTEGEFKYKCEVTKPEVLPETSNLRLRLSAPLVDHESRIVPEYTLSDIKFEDPSGNLIIQYNNVVVRGDSDHTDADDTNFLTYSTSPYINKLDLYEWDTGYPLMHEASGYTLSFTLTGTSFDDAFTGGFDLGFEENRIATNSGQLPLGIRISAIEICNSGGYGPRSEQFLGLYSKVRESGRRIERSIYAIDMPTATDSNGIYPAVSSIWYANNNASFSNLTASGIAKSVDHLQDTRYDRYITLSHTGPVADSGKLNVVVGHRGSDNFHEIIDGAFGYGFDESIFGSWITPSGAFDTQNRQAMEMFDHFFAVESVSLKVLAKKASGSRDYNLDVVGYSDDKLLNVTSATGGFLQNISGVGNFPLTSGFSPTDELGIDGEAISDKSQYYEASGSNNAGGDHYLLSTTPTVNSTSFQWYEVPLKVYKDSVEIGQSRDYSSSSMFEKLYLDIFPLPSGASIANLQLLVRYRPQNALQLITDGGEYNHITSIRDEAKIYPSSKQTDDDIINAGSGYAPLSLIENIPHAYTTPTTIKSNYSRRWRGMEGTTNGPFDPDMFGFDFENPLLDFPFLSGFYDFDYDQGLQVVPRVGTLSGLITTNYTNYRFKNMAWRFQENDLFTDHLPGYSGSYKTTDWTSLSSGVTNFQDNPLYGHIADAFNNVVRISGHNSYINFGDVDISGSFSLYVRFTPDANVSGVGYNLFNSGVLLSKWDTASDLEFALGYESGYLKGIARDTGGTIHEVTDTMPYSGYQFPLSVILTYNDNDSSGLKLYTDNEFEPAWTTLRASSDPFALHVSDNDLIVGHAAGSGVGMNMFVSELGISNAANIVYSNPDLTYKEVTAQTFLENNRVFWWDQGDTTDAYKLWSNIDEDTTTDWTLGDFKYCSFGPAFSSLSQRTGRDLISFNIVHSGTAYINNTDYSLPSTIDSGVAYHTQIENDFLRLNLSDAADNFYSTARRITKSLPRGYKFTEDALVVDTILEHQTDQQIRWSDGHTGPKMIVSLYTKNKDPYWTPDEPNWGLINRDIHYLPASSCMTKIKSVFDYDSLTDTSESWALFPNEPRITDFKEKFFSDDVDDMFLQYDLVYPSGPAFESRINIHTAHIRMEQAYVTPVDNSGTLNLTASGNPSPVSGILNLYTNNATTVSGDIFNLYTVGPLLVQESGFPLFASGLLLATGTLPMFTEGHQSTYIVPNSGFNLVSSGGPYVAPTDVSGTLNISAFGKGIATSSGNGVLGMALTVINTDTSYIPDGSTLRLFAYGDSGVNTIISSLPILTYSDPNYVSDASRSNSSGIMNFVSLASKARVDKRPSASMNLFTSSYTPSSVLNLTAYGDQLTRISKSGTLNLFTANYSSSTDSTYIRWFNNNYGTDIDLEDNIYASKAVDDNIRGIELVGYGSCTGDSTQKAIDPAIITHDTTWRPATCNEGGIFRAFDTYTSGSYSGNYYDIRKYEGLVPNAAYNVELTIRTGITDAIDSAPEWEEWEYGTNSTINYSGIKLIGDYPYLSGDASNIITSGRTTSDNYGKSVSVKGDLMAIGSPYMSIPDESGSALNNAGSVFLYRRQADTAGEKADWNLEKQLILPDSYRGDYSTQVNELVSYENIGSISGSKWNIGQEGRELGHSVAIANSGTKEVVVVGAPGASWSRSFDEINSSGIPVAIMMFVDFFDYDNDKASNVANASRKYDILYKYFSAPWIVSGSEYQPKIDLHLIIYECVNSGDVRSVVPKFNQDWIHHRYIGKLNDVSIPSKFSTEWYDTYNSMLSGVKEGFFEAFPHDTSKIYNNIPPIVSIFQDSSNSLNGAFGDFTEATEEVVDAFEAFYKQHAYASGVENMTTSTAASGYVNRTTGNVEDWDTEAASVINNVLATGNLSNNNALEYITSGIGQEWAKANAYEFQIHPASGGRVYVFENENGNFNLIQEIKSPQEVSYDSYSLGDFDQKANDRFGHAVAISDNSEVISIGSPYSTEACQIYERDASEETRLFNKLGDWLTYRGFSSQKTRLDLLVSLYGAASGQQVLYNELSSTNKFYFRSDELFWNSNGGVPTPYSKIYNYSYRDIPYTGTWRFIPEEFAGTSRLGYSTAVSEDGDTVLFGAPTDSFNEFDDTNVWYKNENSWASYNNAGAVRVFESRKYYPHNLAVEFYKFGNLDKNSHPETSENYEQLSGIFALNNIPFYRTEFDEKEIPQEAGLAFIITPEIDAASDEVINNIKQWLALGDRTLVLVGNDPEFEEGGKYRQSNEILHKILDGLDSRMRIYPARNSTESLQYCADTTNNKYNVTPAKVPANAHSTHVLANNIYASGVGDIRIYLDGSDVSKPNFYISSPCNDLNDKCEIPLEHTGDLRAEWDAQCTKTVGRQIVTVKYKENWPFHFGNETNSQSCDTPPSQLINRPNQEPRPILTAAEWIPERTEIIPATSGWVDQGCTSYTTQKTSSSTVYSFDETQIDQLAFSISGDYTTNDGTNGSGILDYTFDGSFFNPSGFVDTRNGILQSVGTSYHLPAISKTNKLDDYAVLASEETYNNTTSKVILMASLLPENATSMEGKEPRSPNITKNYNDDQNIFFYANILKQSCNDASIVKQLGGWTGRTSFSDAYSKSELLARLSGLTGGLRPDIEENFATEDLTNSMDIVWIANPAGRPSTAQINKLKSWLQSGDKKIVITYDNQITNVDNAYYICEQLGLNSKPYIDRDGDYIVHDTNTIYEGNIIDCCPYTVDALQLVGNSDIITGCTNSFGKSTAVSKLQIAGSYDSTIDSTYDYPYVPINVGDNTTKVIYYDEDVNETYEESNTAWQITGEADLEFDVIPSSGYRLFYSWVTEKANETYAINMSISNASTNPDPENPTGVSIVNKTLSGTSRGMPESSYVDIRIPSNVSGLKVKFDTNRWRNIDSDNPKPYTPRVLSLSGCLVPINSQVILSTATVLDTSISPNPVCSGYWKPIPERTVTIPAQFRPIMTDNTKYCNSYPNVTGECATKAGVLIEDGPIVVAEEQEHFSSFTTGSQRSRIILISDSTIVQGACPTYRDDVYSGNQAFIRSLYPAQPSAGYSFQSTSTTSSSARKFNHVQKLVAPERYSPAKLFAVSGLSGSVDRFGLAGVAGNTGNYIDSENSFVPGDVTRPKDPKPEQMKDYIQYFGNTVVPTYGTYPRFSGSYIDASINGGIPEILRLTGSDHIDFNANPSGYPGDLFGYSVDIHENKIVVGSPFHPLSEETIATWSGVATGSGMQISNNGGAGAVFYFENTGSGENAVSSLLPWEFKHKIRPSSINVGTDGATTSQITAERGQHFLSSDFILKYASVTDKFGYDVSIDSDFVAIGAPGHDYETLHDHIYRGDAAFIRKEFNSEFNIPQHNFYDLGSSGVRIDQFNGSGTMVMNNGAVFTYQHRMTDWSNRTKEWVFAEKITAQGYNSRVQTGPLQPSGSENDQFGTSVSLNRSRRGDSDYVMTVGAPYHAYATSGDHVSSQPLIDAGASYTYDAMLREQTPTLPSSGAFIIATTFGNKASDNLSLTVHQNTTGGSRQYSVSGLVFASPSGSLFLEASGYDPASKGLTSHRPYVESIIGSIANGVQVTGYLGFITSGKPFSNSGQLNLVTIGPNSDYVYNTLGLHATSWNTIEVGSGTDPFNLHTEGGSGINVSGIFNLVTSGISTVDNSGNPLNLRTRGK